MALPSESSGFQYFHSVIVQAWASTMGVRSNSPKRRFSTNPDTKCQWDQEDVPCSPEQEYPVQPPPYFRKLWLSFAFFMAAVTWNSMFQVISESVVQPDNQVLLIDVSHTLSNRFLSSFIPASSIIDILLLVLLAMTIGAFAFLGPRSIALVVLRRYLFLQGIIFLIRGPAIYMTILPKTITDPEECLFESSGSFIVDTVMVVLRQKVTCTDLFFSGHTAMITLWAILITWHIFPKSFITPMQRYIYTVFMTTFWSLTIFVVSMIALTKFHYSIDVYVGVLLPLILTCAYYDVVTTIPFLQSGAVSLSPTQAIVMWLEDDSGYGTI
uniref:Sphingomyelin synthase-like domain-containing protein n=1 Tax=Spongospora subterranea TaxID=70186 RepID=A0A0H5RNL0_9EUKA|eukprot:CRZ10309.1 hypothetical protein [Spongospora subterranea]